jgi:putative hydroxymethylpyrimidine transport system permease protein
MKYYRSMIIFVGFLLIWQIIILLMKLPSYILPSPLLVGKSFIQNFSIIVHEAIPTMIETITALFLGVFVGMLTALLMSYFRFAKHWFLPLVIISQSIPTFAIAPLLVLWFGYGISSKIITAIIMLFFPVTATFYDGLMQTDPEYLALAKVMNASRFSILRHIRLPNALPSLASGLKMAAIIAPLGAVIGEWVGSSQGLGYLMLNANARMQIDLMFATLVVIILFALALYYLCDLFMKRLIKC